ncbi:hypothetical protein GCWU000324_00941 [Kingella oralis ATCC 51147]|uniref:Uncharacterized protein n=1 Tax=Kingella oralis ATCC 51147 TaxID=629741 RepID=C4GFM5_9NEIS|nr:hypothetical protein GCWU000324_00941 [Kingella oralis ATCC 51147]
MRQPEKAFFRLLMATKILNKLHKPHTKRLKYALSFSGLR